LFEILKALVQDLKRRRRRRRKRRRRKKKRKEMALDAKLEVCLAHTLYPIVHGA